MKIGDLTDFGSFDDVSKSVSIICDSLDKLTHEMHKENDRDLSLYNLAINASFEVKQIIKIIQKYSESPEVKNIAWRTRNIFEINLIIRYILQSKENLDCWMGQFAYDEIQILEGYLELAENKSHPSLKIIKGRLDKIKNICEKHRIEPKKFLHISELAKKTGVYDEYKSLYKLYSKYAHPSSWIINASFEKVNSIEYLNMLLINVQKYAWDLYRRISETVGLLT